MRNVMQQYHQRMQMRSQVPGAALRMVNPRAGLGLAFDPNSIVRGNAVLAEKTQPDFNLVIYKWADAPKDWSSLSDFELGYKSDDSGNDWITKSHFAMERLKGQLKTTTGAKLAEVQESIRVGNAVKLQIALEMDRRNIAEHRREAARQYAMEEGRKDAQGSGGNTDSSQSAMESSSGGFPSWLKWGGVVVVVGLGIYLAKPKRASNG